MSNDLQLELSKAIGEISQATKQMAVSQQAIEANLKILNDQNILHSTRNDEQHQKLSEQIMLLTGRYWWLILGLLATVLLVMGYKEAIKFVGV
jgi:uncharacterized membrane protein